MSEHASIVTWALGLVGAVAGGLLGYLAFSVLARQGLYAMVLPGALTGIGCGFLSGTKSNGLGVLCGVLAVMLGVFTEWRFFPFRADDSFEFFVWHVHDLRPTRLIMIAVGGLFGYWFGRGREGGVWLRRRELDDDV